MRRDEMRSAHHRPYRINAADAIHHQGAAMLVSGKIRLPVDDARRPARPGIVPLMPLFGAQPQIVNLPGGQFPLDVLHQGLGPDPQLETIPSSLRSRANSQAVAASTEEYTPLAKFSAEAIGTPPPNSLGLNLHVLFSINRGLLLFGPKNSGGQRAEGHLTARCWGRHCLIPDTHKASPQKRLFRLGPQRFGMTQSCGSGPIRQSSLTQAFTSTSAPPPNSCILASIISSALFSVW